MMNERVSSLSRKVWHIFCVWPGEEIVAVISNNWIQATLLVVVDGYYPEEQKARNFRLMLGLCQKEIPMNQMRSPPREYKE